MHDDVIPGRLRRNPVLEEAPLQDELMLFNPVNSNFYVLNPTMAMTWKRIGSDTSVQQIATEIQSHFSGVTQEDAQSDVRKALQDLVVLGLASQTE